MPLCYLLALTLDLSPRFILPRIPRSGAPNAHRHLAGNAGVVVDTVRYYERRGLLPEPARRPSGYRDYGDDELQQRFVRRCKALVSP